MVARLELKEFTISGEVLDTAFVRVRALFEREAIAQMRQEGYTPILDMNPKVFTSVDENGKRHLSVTVYGAYVGDVDAEGVSEWKVIPRSRPAKSKQS